MAKKRKKKVVQDANEINPLDKMILLFRSIPKEYLPDFADCMFDVKIDHKLSKKAMVELIIKHIEIKE